MMMLRGILPVTLTVVVLSSAVQRPVGAQRSDSTRAGVKRDSDPVSAMRPAALTRPVHADAPSRVVRVVHDGLIGAGIGAATGLMAAFILVNQSNVTDHSEDGLAFFILGVDGGLLGLIVGAIVGLFRGP